MRNRMTRGLNGYVLSPFGAADMNDPGYGWGGPGATATVGTAQPASGDSNIVGSIFSAIGGVGNAVASIFGAKVPTAQPLLTAEQQQALLARQQAAQQAAQSAKNLPLYIGGGLAALLLIGLVLKK